MNEQTKRNIDSMQERAAQAVKQLPPEQIICRICGEQSAGGPLKGYCHKFEQQAHIFIAEAK